MLSRIRDRPAQAANATGAAVGGLERYRRLVTPVRPAQQLVPDRTGHQVTDDDLRPGVHDSPVDQPGVLRARHPAPAAGVHVDA